MAFVTAETAKLLQTRAAEMTAMPTGFSKATVTPDIFPTRVVVNSKPVCVPSEEYTACHDDILAIDFEYPSNWGEISALFSQGGYAGFSYEYYFSGSYVGQRAGGRSRDFAEGRGGILTDFLGFGSDPAGAQSTCQHFAADICKAVQPGVVFMMRLLKSDLSCNPELQVASEIGMVAVNMPQGPKINGFLFASGILSDQLENDLDAILSSDPKIRQEKCEDAALRQQFDAKVNEIKDAIEAGTVDIETQANIDRLLYLARSIQFD
jgi:hypothetical protein